MKSWIPYEQEEFKAVFTSGRQSCWHRAADLQHWRVILSTLMVDRNGPTIPVDSQFCCDASSYVDIMPAIPPPTLKQLAANPNQIGNALQDHGPKRSAAQASLCGNRYGAFAPALKQNMESDKQEYSEVLEPEVSRPRAGTVPHKAVRSPMKKVAYIVIVWCTIACYHPAVVSIHRKAVFEF